MIELFRIFLT